MEERHQGSTGADVVRAFLAGDVAGVLGRLADGAVLHSPARDYADRPAIAAVLTALAGVLEAPAATAVLRDGDETVAFFTAAVLGRSGDGVLRVTAPGGGPATELTLMVRPFAVLRDGMEEMGRRLAAAPA